jgi:hypothetical protein
MDQILKDLRLDDDNVTEKTVPASSSKLLSCRSASKNFNDSFHYNNLYHLETELSWERIREQQHHLHNAPMCVIHAKPENGTFKIIVIAREIPQSHERQGYDTQTLWWQGHGNLCRRQFFRQLGIKWDVGSKYSLIKTRLHHLTCCWMPYHMEITAANSNCLIEYWKWVHQFVMRIMRYYSNDGTTKGNEEA